jgi:hypothetical protein
VAANPRGSVALSMRSYSDIPKLKALERYFDSAARFSVFGCLADESDLESSREPSAIQPLYLCWINAYGINRGVLLGPRDSHTYGDRRRWERWRTNTNTRRAKATDKDLLLQTRVDMKTACSIHIKNEPRTNRGW